MNNVSSRAYIGLRVKIVEQFQSFCDSLDIKSLNPAISITTGDFNGKCLKWYFFNTSDNIGKRLDTITSTAGHGEITDKPSHFRNNSFSCIGPIFTSHPNIIVDSDIENSICSNCHHDIIYGKINFRVPLPPQHFRTICYYKNPDASSIQHAIET